MKSFQLGVLLLATCASSVLSATTPAPTGCETVSCPAVNGEFAVHKPHPFRCDSFCKCDWGKGVYFKCPPGLHFNKVKEVCDWPEEAGCDSSGGGVTEEPDCDLSTTTAAPGGGGDPPPANGCEKVTCPADSNSGLAIHLPNPDDCGSFCKCDWGVPIYFECPDGLHFNAALQVCDWPENAGCTGGGGGEDPPNSGPINGCQYERCPEENTNPLTNLANPDDCGSFCQCYDGVANWIECSADLHFNPINQICEHPLNAGCEVAGTSTTRTPPTTTKPATNPTTTKPATNATTTKPSSNPTTTKPSEQPIYCRNVVCPENSNSGPVISLPNPEDCSSYCVCDWGKPILMPCAPGLHFNPALGLCDWPENAGCSEYTPPEIEDNCNLAQCPSGNCGPVNLPNPGNCDSFCRCEGGSGSYRPCPPGLLFDPSSGICDFPGNVVCEGDEEITDPTTTPIDPTTITTTPTSETSPTTTPLTTTTTKPTTNITTTKSPSTTTKAPTTPGNTPPPGACKDVKCPAENGEFAVHLPNPGDCGSFCKCDWGVPVWVDCPGDLHFNPVLQVCDWPQNAGCTEEGDPGVTGTPPVGETTTTPGGGVTTTTTRRPGGETTTQPRPTCPNVQCPAENGDFALHLPNPGDCGSFCKCDWGSGYLFDCPGDLHFNPVLQICDWPENAGCTEEGDPGFTPTPPNGGTTTTTKPGGPTTPRPTCPNVQCPAQNGDFALHLPIPGDCGSFCKCDWGAGFVFPCPDGLHFNAQLQVCDWPQYAGCDGPALTTVPSEGGEDFPADPMPY